MIFQIRGCSGSGKTWVVRQLLAKFEFLPTIEGNKIKGYYSKDINLFILGSYANACGGADTILTQDETVKRVLAAHEKGYNVLFEGLISSHIAARYVDLFILEPETYFLCLDTPYAVCALNIIKRRKEKGAQLDKPLKTVSEGYKNTHKSRENMLLMGVPESHMPLMSNENALLFILNRLKNKKE